MRLKVSKLAMVRGDEPWVTEVVNKFIGQQVMICCNSV